MLIVMAGLPGTGKSTLSRKLVSALNGVVLDKDTVRSALFPDRFTEYSAEQDDLVVSILYQVAEYYFRKYPGMAVLIDGRLFSRRYQVQGVVEFAARVQEPLRIIECVCSDETAERRLEHATAHGTHPAKNRSYELYLSIKARWEPIQEPKLVLDTDSDLEVCAARALRYIQSDSS
jgi:adenylylsulfate kinase